MMTATIGNSSCAQMMQSCSAQQSNVAPNGTLEVSRVLQALSQAVAMLTQIISPLGKGGAKSALEGSSAVGFKATSEGTSAAPITRSKSVGQSSGSTFLQKGTLQVGVNWEGLNAINRAGKTPDMVRKFDDFDNAQLSAREKELVAQGSMLFKSLKPKIGKSGQSISWAEVASGKHDAFLKEYLQNIKRDGGENVVLAFNHEPDGKQNADKGTPADFVAAWRHIHDLADQVGATRKTGGNVEFAWTMVGWGFEIDRVGAYYPGNEYVDYVGTDPYDTSKRGERRSFTDTVSGTLRWMDKNGIDKPVIVGETGTETGSSAQRQGNQTAWVQQMMNDLQTNPALQRIVAVNYWSNQVSGAGHVNYNLDPSAASVLASYM